jgi:anti-sigma factor RsiW
MNITRDVVQDLWPVYVSGEASRDTTKLVDEFLAKDAEFATRLRSADAETALASHALVPPDVERRALTKAKRLLRRQRTVFSLALMFTLFPLSFRFGSGEGFQWTVLRDTPELAVALWVAAAVLWGVFYFIGRGSGSSTSFVRPS